MNQKAASSVYILRLGHRPQRDKRITTHIMLAARALGASGVYYSGEKDTTVEKKLNDVTSRWGGSFRVEYVKNWRKFLLEWKRKDREVIHLTMYGIPIQDIISVIKSTDRDKLVVVGGPKVPKEIFEIADFNVAITSQPHSEVSALAIFLHEIFEGKELKRSFEGAKIRIIPQAKGKKVIAII
ncbi:TPA: tRNA (cytidine(56)-2'-O)-methyltransferase [Candidatus Bathyarchaeota archaeon]|nr:tRNA (cytidine(56)-2'-O)-methyltransferase [Candidatus Bathyarchaeota archaeon]